jgi:Holliday junction resolvasome RuvABC endonuclease subunit
MIFIGIDPDLHNLSWAAIDTTRTVVAVQVISISRTYKGWAAVVKMIQAIEKTSPLAFTIPNYSGPSRTVLESQQIYFGKSKASPESILMLAHLTGAIHAKVLSQNKISALVKPRQWKGSVPKAIHQERILKQVGWRSKRTQGYCYPTNAPFDLKVSQWKHAVDAIGLALYGLSNFKRQSIWH